MIIEIHNEGCYNRAAEQYLGINIKYKSRLIMEKWNIFPYANPKGWHYTSRERAEGEWTCDHEKENNVHPVGVHIWGTLWVPHYRDVNVHPQGAHMGAL